MRKSLVFCVVSMALIAVSAAAGGWTARAPLPAPRCAGGSGIAVVNGSIILVGEANDEYSLAGNSWSANAPNPRPIGRTNLNSNAVLGDVVYFFGGKNVDNGTNAQSVDTYNATLDSWTLNVANYPLPIASVGTIPLGTNLYVFGGEFFGTATIATRFEPGLNHFFVLSSLPTGRIDPVVVNQNGKLWVIGGNDGVSPIATVDIFDPLFGTWSSGPALPVASNAHAGGVVGGDIHVLLDAGVYRLNGGTWTQVGSAPPQAGNYAAVFANDELHAIGGCSTEHYVLQISPTAADTTAPSIVSVTPSPSVLTVPNHKMVPVSVSVVATDDTDPAPVAKITSVTSSEPDNGLGDGDTVNDIRITGPLTVELRAERAGKGPGRTYTITVEVKDAAGNVATATTAVFVPKK